MRTTIICSVLLFILGFVTGYAWGWFDANKQTKFVKRPCSGYVVLNGNHVITCAGDTIEYNWKIK